MIFKIATVVAFVASVSAECPIVGTYKGTTSLTPGGRAVTQGCVNSGTGNRLVESDFVPGTGFVPSNPPRPCVAATCSNVDIVVTAGSGDICKVEISDCFSNFAGEPVKGTLGYDCSLEPTKANKDFACVLESFAIGGFSLNSLNGVLTIEGSINGNGSVNWEVYGAGKVGSTMLSRKGSRKLRG
ncbi:hypothetical protein IV203_028044 [Nitzschia inconspicua]|uniref:Uncharacterized protein n=1 Tax=Nitzschia inconspicua TaxID=303405 RepID=A0A9K3LXB2_9STRA|nr:hypothetical protein IV203_028044 [Nitzschia inconspicua]